MSAFASSKEKSKHKHSSAAGSQTELERAKWKSVMGTKGSERREFFPKSVGSDGKLHHGAFFLGNLKSKKFTRHNSIEETHVIERCNFAYGWIGETLQFVRTMCTSENWKFCKENVSHKEHEWGEKVDDNDHDDGDRDDEGDEENGAEASDWWMTLGHNRFSALSK